MSAVTYTNDRHADWTYDAAGNATQQAEDTVFSFDAAGRLVNAYNPLYMEACGVTTPYVVALANDTTYDGDGETTKQSETRTTSGSGGGSLTKHTYYLRSAALGGEAIDIMNNFGVKQQGMVFADGGILAKQWKNGSFEKVRWEHTNPATGVIWRTDDTGTLLGREELDPLGAEMGKVNPYTSGSGGGGTGGDCEGVHVHTQQPAANDVDGSCYLNGVAAPCGMVMNMLNHGAGTEVDLGKTDEWGRPHQEAPKRPTDDISAILAKTIDGFKNPRQLELSHRLSADSSTASSDDDDKTNPESANNRKERSFSVQVSSGPDKRDLPGIVGATPEQQQIITDALNDLIDRIKQNKGKNPCADLYGGMNKALNALKKSRISVDDLGPVQLIPSNPPITTNDQSMETVGKTITVNSNVMFAPGGMVKLEDYFSHKPLPSINIPASTVLDFSLGFGHELGHLTNAKGFTQDDGQISGQAENDQNTELVKKACGYN
jgi:hypothetical protein